MRLAVIVLVLSIAVLAALYFTGIIVVTAEAINISAGKTSIATTYTSFAVVSVWVISMLFALAGLIGSGFRKGFFWILLLLLAAAGAAIFYFYIYK